MRVVVDTNVFISAVLKDKSLPALALRQVDRCCVLIKSVVTEQQLFEVLSRPYFASLVPLASHELLKNMMAAAEPVTITEHVIACRDPTDDKFLELAVNGLADGIVSGDNDLLVLHPFRGIPIFTPASFLAWAG